MIMTYSDYLPFIKELGIFIGSIAALVSILIKVLDKYNFGTSRKNKFKLTKHRLFTTIDNLLNYSVSNLDLGVSPEREILFKAMIRIKLEVCRKRFYEFAEKEYSFSDLDDFCNKNINLLYDIINEYKAKWRADGVPEKAITKFEEWHETKERGAVEEIKRRAVSGVCNTTGEKLHAIYEYHDMILQQLFFDSEYEFKRINGELNGEFYKNMPL